MQTRSKLQAERTGWAGVGVGGGRPNPGPGGWTRELGRQGTPPAIVSPSHRGLLGCGEKGTPPPRASAFLLEKGRLTPLGTMNLGHKDRAL